MNIDKYLDRIGVNVDEVAPTESVLRRLQHQHLLHVPFENLDIHWKRPIVLDTGRFYTKIVEERRGGFCYELNGLFNELLTAIGFKTRLVSARVFNGSGHGPEFDHMAIVVTLGEEEFIVDVGFGDFASEPLRFLIDVEQADQAGVFTITKLDEKYLDISKKSADGWKSEFIFSDVARDLTDFAAMCDFQQYSPDSHFVKGKICSILTDNGRKTLTEKKFIRVADGERIEREISSDADLDDTLKKEFGIGKGTNLYE